MDFDELELPTVTVSDESGRQLSCYVEHSLQLEDVAYAVLMPVDIPVCLMGWIDEDDEPFLVDSDDEIEALYPSAKAVLEEQNIVLHWTAFTLTVSGDIPDIEEEDESYGYEPEDANGSDSHEVYQLLANFYYKDQEYAVCAPFDPCLYLARMENGHPQVLLGSELEKMQPVLEELLAKQVNIDTLDDDDDDEDYDFEEEEE